MQKVSCVVTTAALSAGVDFPASQVIFAALTMGIKWLTVADFEQMSGRAGRLKKHDLGRVYLLVTPGKNYVAAGSDTEDRVAARLLGGRIEPLSLTPEEPAHFTEILATISMYTPLGNDEEGMPLENLTQYHEFLFNGNFDLKSAILFLQEGDFCRKVHNNRHIRVTQFGRAAAESFLRVDKATEIRALLMQKVTETQPAPDMIDIARKFHPFNNVYVTNRILSELSAKNEGRATSNYLFSSPCVS